MTITREDLEALAARWGERGTPPYSFHDKGSRPPYDEGCQDTYDACAADLLALLAARPEPEAVEPAKAPPAVMDVARLPGLWDEQAKGEHWRAAEAMQDCAEHLRSWLKHPQPSDEEWTDPTKREAIITKWRERGFILVRRETVRKQIPAGGEELRTYELRTTLTEAQRAIAEAVAELRAYVQACGYTKPTIGRALAALLRAPGRDRWSMWDEQEDEAT